MNKLNQALATLRPLMTISDPNGIILAEKAIDEAVAATRQEKRLALLNELRTAVTPTGENKNKKHVQFAENLLALIDNRIASLGEME
jgi:hypothetical protein